MGYSAVYGRYVNKNIPVFGDYRTIFNSELIWDEKTITLASLKNCVPNSIALIPSHLVMGSLRGMYKIFTKEADTNEKK